MTFTLTTSGAILGLAGQNVSASAAASGALLGKFCDEAEGAVCAYSKVDWITRYSEVLTVGKQLLDLAVASLAANSLITYDMSGYTNNGEATTMLNVNLNNFNKTIARLEDQDFKNFLLQVA